MKLEFNSYLESLSKNLRLHVSTAIVLSLNFSIVITLFLFSDNFSRSLEKWSKNAELNVYLEDDISEVDKSKLLASFENNKNIKELKFIDRESSKNEFKESLKEILPEVSELDDIENPFSDTYSVKLVQQTNIAELPAKLASISAEIEKFSGVEEVSYGKSWFDNFTSFLLGINIGISTLITIISLACLLVIANVIRSSIEKRRDEIEILELVGATKNAIRKPFLIEGSLIGLISGISALIFAKIAFSILTSSLAPYLGVLDLNNKIHFLSFGQMLLCVILCGCIGMLSSYLTTRKINTGWAASMGLEK